MFKIPDTLLPTALLAAEYKVARYHLDAPVGTAKDMLLDPDYWVHVSRKLRRGDIVEVLALDGSFDVELRVHSVDPRGLWAQMIVRLDVKMPKTALAPAGQWPDKDGYSVEFSGPHLWRLLHRAAGVVAKGFETEAAAIAALAEIKKAKTGQ